MRLVVHRPSFSILRKNSPEGMIPKFATGNDQKFISPLSLSRIYSEHFPVIGP